ncbi:MAG: hypothetical protein ACE5WD_11565 [Candidatus Aminicenantia bacterium]
MNEIEELSKLEVDKLPPLKNIFLDDLHNNVLKKLHLELGSGPVLFLLSPSFSILNPESDEKINDFISKKESLLHYLKKYIIQNLAFYSVILEVNSYFIEQNNYLVLARLRERNSDGKKYEIKFYTHSPLELTVHYEDKIYIGRDFIDLFHFKRKYFGIDELINSTKEQYYILVERGKEKLKNFNQYNSNFFREIKELVNEFYTESIRILHSIPPYLDFDQVDFKDLMEINSQYRTINHFLIELKDEVGEFENVLRYNKETSFVRYVTKYKKDLTNLISYFNIKVNGRIMERINLLSQIKY